MSQPLVLLPGLMCDAGLWQAMLPQLQAIGPLTFGDLSAGDSVPAMASQVLADCPPRFTLIGFSMGGFVAREIARRAPERVAKLVLIASSCAADTPQQAAFKQAVAHALQQSSGAFRGLGHKAIALSLGAQHAGDAQLQQQILAMSLRLGRETYIRQLRMPRDSDSHLLAQIGCPTLVVSAADDRMRSVGESQALCDALPDGCHVTLSDSGHMLPLEQPQRLAALISGWLADGKLNDA